MSVTSGRQPEIWQDAKSTEPVFAIHYSSTDRGLLNTAARTRSRRYTTGMADVKERVCLHAEMGIRLSRLSFRLSSSVQGTN
jgi:hypothetical protein